MHNSVWGFIFALAVGGISQFVRGAWPSAPWWLERCLFLASLVIAAIAIIGFLYESGWSVHPYWDALGWSKHVNPYILFMAISALVFVVSLAGYFIDHANVERAVTLKPAPAPPAPVQLPQSGRPSLSAFTNTQVKEQALALVMAVRAFAINFQKEEMRIMNETMSGARTPEEKEIAERRWRDGMRQRHIDMRTQYYHQYATRANALYDELLRRNGIFQRPQQSIQTHIFESPENFAGGAGVVFEGMKKLEQLANDLRDE